MVLESIKKDRVTQILIGVAVLVALVVCVIFAAVGLRYFGGGQQNSLPTPDPNTPPDSGLIVDKQQFEGEGNKVESFTIYREGLVYFTASQNADRPTKTFSVWLKNSNGENIKLLMLSKGTSTNEVVENLPPGQYILEISGDIWAITVLHEK